MTIDGFWDYDFDPHPFTGLRSYDQATRVFGSRDALDLVLGTATSRSSATMDRTRRSGPAPDPRQRRIDANDVAHP